MVIFNSYVSLPEGMWFNPQKKHDFLELFFVTSGVTSLHGVFNMNGAVIILSLLAGHGIHLI